MVMSVLRISKLLTEKVPSTKPSKALKFEDQAVSIKDFEAFCDISLDAAPSAKPIDACRSVLQELERALK